MNPSFEEKAREMQLGLTHSPVVGNSLRPSLCLIRRSRCRIRPHLSKKYQTKCAVCAEWIEHLKAKKDHPSFLQGWCKPSPRCLPTSILAHFMAIFLKTCQKIFFLKKICVIFRVAFLLSKVSVPFSDIYEFSGNRKFDHPVDFLLVIAVIVSKE